jgi:hypothetical protein
MRRSTGFLAYLIACCAGWIQRQQAEALGASEHRRMRRKTGLSSCKGTPDSLPEIP